MPQQAQAPWEQQYAQDTPWEQSYQQESSTPAAGVSPEQSARIDAMQKSATPPENYGFTLPNLGANLWSGFKAPFTGAYAVGKDLLQNPNWLMSTPGDESTLSKFITGPMAAERAKASQSPSMIEAAGHEAAGLIPLIGPWAGSLGEQAGRGDIGGALAQGVGTAAGANVLGRIPSAVRVLPKLPGRTQEFALQNPNATRVIGATGGAALGMIPSLFGEGSLYIPAGGAAGGEWLAERVINAARDKAASDVARGTREIRPGDVPDTLAAAANRQTRALQNYYANYIAQTGETPEELKVPTAMREGLKKFYEERVKNVPQLPNLVKTPEEVRAQALTDQAYEAARQDMLAAARLRGTAHPAGYATPQWVGARRGVEQSTSRTSRIFPKIP